MPISYSDDISDGRGFTIFYKVLKRWKGSLYKLVWIDLLGYIGLYYLINFTYRFGLSGNQKTNFEKIVKFADSMKSNIPISFLLGFFVSGVIARWFQLYLYIPWLNRMAFLIEGMLNGGNKEKCRKIRQTLLRYMNLAWILCMRPVSEPIRSRFRPEEDDKSEQQGVRSTLINFNRDRKIQSTYRKIITDGEIRAFESIAVKNYSRNRTKYLPEYWVPIQWASRLIQKAFVHGYISDPKTLNSLIDELDRLRGQMQTLQIFSGIMIPLVYTQVIIIAVYSYFLCQIFASQFVDPNSKIKGHEVDLYIPIFTIFQFLFFMGWLKVAMCVMNPFGDDDEDFQTQDMLDYNLDVTYRSVTADPGMYPELLDPPTMWYPLQKCAEKDELDLFMDEIDGDIEEIEVPNVEADVTALELKPNKISRILNLVTCGFYDSQRVPLTATPKEKSNSKLVKEPFFDKLDSARNNSDKQGSGSIEEEEENNGKIEEDSVVRNV